MWLNVPDRWHWKCSKEVMRNILNSTDCEQICQMLVWCFNSCFVRSCRTYLRRRVGKLPFNIRALKRTPLCEITERTKQSVLRKSPPPPPPRHHNTDPFNIKNVAGVRWSDGVQRTRVSTGQLSRSHSPYYTASLLMSEATTQMSVRLVNSDVRQQHVRFLKTQNVQCPSRGRNQGAGLKR